MPAHREGAFSAHVRIYRDGERGLVFRRANELQLFSRNQKLLNEKYPELVSAFKAQKTQQEKFVELARQLAADKNEEVFTDKLRRIAKAKASKKKRS